MAPRSRQSSSARSTRSGTSRRSGISTDASDGLCASTRASSFSASNGAAYSPTTSTEGDVVTAPPTTPEDPLDRMNAEQSLKASLDALYAPTANYVNMVHMHQMAQYLQTPDAQQSLDTLLSLVKDKDSRADAASDYHTALDELDYLEGLFKKLRFSYKEQLTKETVVRRILELELPLLSAADIDQMVRETEAERQQLRQIKAGGEAQRAAAEQLIRGLTAERAYVATAEAETTQLPDRVLRLRHRLARMKLALQAELEAIDAVSSRAGAGAAADSSSHACGTCGRSFYSAAFRQMHQAMHRLQDSQRQRGDNGLATTDGADALDFGDATAAAAATAATALRRCHGCTQMVPAVFLDAASPQGETHKAFHARIRAAAAEAAEKLGAATESSSSAKAAFQREDMALQGEAGEAGDVLRQLQSSASDLAALEKRVRSEAERQAAIEGEMTQSLQHLRESVGSIRLEMARIEQEADRMVQYLEEGRTHLGRSLQEQTDLFNVLLLGDDNDDGDSDEDEDDEMDD